MAAFHNFRGRLDLVPGLNSGICSSSFPWSLSCCKDVFCFQISNICLSFISSLPFLACLLIWIWVYLLSFPPLWFPDIAPCSLFYLQHPPVPSALLSSLKWVFRCQCQSVGGGNESVSLTVSLAMSISADCHISVMGGGGEALLICPCTIICHNSLLIWWAMTCLS